MSRPSDSDPLLGRVLDGKYTLQSVLGRGGMGVVYKAHQSTLERPVALKLLRGFSGDEDTEQREQEHQREQEFQRRFFLEAATAAKLKHPNTITVFDYGSTSVDDEKVFYITMELLDGVTLSKVLQSHGPLPPMRAVHIALQICRALREAHASGIVHRDLKPGNVMLVTNDDDDDGDFVKVLDFGLAKTKKAGPGAQLTKAGTFLGSPRYVAPEQIEGKAVDARADIYSFGCVMYRMLTGRVPFDGQQAVEVMMRHLNDPVPPLSAEGLVVPEVLERLALSCLAKKASERPASMDEVIAGLKRARGELGGVFSGNVAIPEDVRAKLRADLANATAAGSAGLAATPGAAEQTSPSQAAPPRAPSTSSPSRSSTSSPSSPSAASSASSSASSSPPATTLAPPAPTVRSGSISSSGVSSSALSSSALTSSGEWRIGGAPDEASRSSRPGRLTVIQPKRRTWPAVAAGALIGLACAGTMVAGRLGVFDPWLEQRAMRVTEPTATMTRAAAAASARLRIMTTPAGADVFEVLPTGIRLIGLTPLTVPWEIAVGDGGRQFQLKKKGFVTSRARVDPPAPSTTNDPVVLDVEATLRPAPPP